MRSALSEGCIERQKICLAARHREALVSHPRRPPPSAPPFIELDLNIVKKQPFLAALHPFHVEPQFPGDLAAHGTIRLTLLPSGPDVVHEAPLRKTQALRPDLKKDIKMAESERFELSIQVSPYTRFPGVLLQPLGQLSTMLYYKKLFSFVALPRDCRLQRYISYHLELILSTPFFIFSQKNLRRTICGDSLYYQMKRPARPADSKETRIPESSM